MEDDGYANWREAWEGEAQKTAQAYHSWSDDELLGRVQAAASDPFFTLWDEVSRRNNPLRYAWPTFRILEQPDVTYLTRYHASVALFQLCHWTSPADEELRLRAVCDVPDQKTALSEIRRRLHALDLTT